MPLKTLIETLLILCFTTNLSATVVYPEENTILWEELEQVHIPKVTFDDTTLSVALDFIRQSVEENSDKKWSFEFEFLNDHLKDRKVTFTAKNLSTQRIISIALQMAGADYHYEYSQKKIVIFEKVIVTEVRYYQTLIDYRSEHIEVGYPFLFSPDFEEDLTKNPRISYSVFRDRASLEHFQSTLSRLVFSQGMLPHEEEFEPQECFAAIIVKTSHGNFSITFARDGMNFQGLEIPSFDWPSDWLRLQDEVLYYVPTVNYLDFKKWMNADYNNLIYTEPR